MELPYRTVSSSKLILNNRGLDGIKVDVLQEVKAAASTSLTPQSHKLVTTWYDSDQEQP